MNQNKFISFFKIAFNPFRALSLLFRVISLSFGYFADLFDRLVGEINTNVNIVEENIKSKSKKIISDRVGKIIILFLLVCLFFIWFNYLNKGIV